MAAAGSSAASFARLRSNSSGSAARIQQCRVTAGCAARSSAHRNRPMYPSAPVTRISRARMAVTSGPVSRIGAETLRDGGDPAFDAEGDTAGMQRHTCALHVERAAEMIVVEIHRAYGQAPVEHQLVFDRQQ